LANVIDPGIIFLRTVDKALVIVIGMYRWPEVITMSVPVLPTNLRRGQTMAFRFFALFAIVLAQIGIVSARAQHSDETIRMSVGASEMIALSENPSTGYKWQLDRAHSSNLTIVRVIDVAYQPGQTGLIGAPGLHRWQIQARVPGTARIVFAYSRPWEQAAPAKSHSIEVNITRSQ
jgi:inhibitor of cysteine peptidase